MRDDFHGTRGPGPWVRRMAPILVGLVLLGLAGVALAQGNYDLSWWTVDSGGGTSGAGGYVLSGVVGQPEAGTLEAGGYRLVGGFAGGLVDVSPTPTPPPPASPGNRLYLPLVVR